MQNNKEQKQTAKWLDNIRKQAKKKRKSQNYLSNKTDVKLKMKVKQKS